jgi:hypothetical protein
MESALEGQYLVFVRSHGKHDATPEEAEMHMVSCLSYEEAHRIKSQWNQAGRACVIRYEGPAGGGD